MKNQKTFIMSKLLFEFQESVQKNTFFIPPVRVNSCFMLLTCLRDLMN